MKKLKKLFNALILIAVILIRFGGLFGIYEVFHAIANASRGYNAVGGEIFVLLIPVLWYCIKDTARKTKETIKK